MLELLETIDKLEQDLSDVLDQMQEGGPLGQLMDRAGHLDWEIRVRTEAILKLLREQYAHA